MKMCAKCGEEKAETEFHNDKSREDGKHPWCKSCKKVATKLYYHSHKKEAYASLKKWRSENHERFLSTLRANHKAHSAERVAKKKQWRANRSEELRQKELVASKTWKVKHPINSMIIRLNRRARKFGLNEKLTVQDYHTVIERFGAKCLGCGSQENIVLDHIQPLGRSGHNTVDNLQPLCYRCNQLKHLRTADYRRIDENIL